jgi:hypothetical protein
MKVWLILIMMNGTEPHEFKREVTFGECASGIAAQVIVDEQMQDHPKWTWDGHWSCRIGEPPTAT